MANHKSAIKRARQSLRRNAINTRTLSEIRKIEKNLKSAVSKKDKKASEELLVKYMSRTDKAMQKGRLHYKTASRKIGRIAKTVASL